MGLFEEPSVPPSFAALGVNMNYLLLGIYGWEYFLSFHIEWALISGRMCFRPSLIPYVLGRICLLIYLILIVVATSPYSKGLPCLPGGLLITLLSGIGLSCCSTNFMTRTWVIWKNSRSVHALLLLLATGQWALMVLNATNVRMMEESGLCRVYLKYPQMNAITIIYTTLLDFLVLVLSIVGLSSQRSTFPLKNRLRAQGLLYFAIAGITNVPIIVASFLHEIALFFLASSIGGVVGTIASSWAVRSLHALDNGVSSESNLALTTQIVAEHTVY